MPSTWGMISRSVPPYSPEDTFRHAVICSLFGPLVRLGDPEVDGEDDPSGEARAVPSVQLALPAGLVHTRRSRRVQRVAAATRR